MESEDDMDYESDADEVEEIEVANLASLRSKKVTVDNSNGTLRCPWSPSRKKQAYAYKDLLQHATAVSTGTRGVTEVGQHRALKTFLETDLKHLAEPPVKRVFKLHQRPPERMVGELKHVFPWSVVVYNIDNSIRDQAKGMQVGVGRSELRDHFSSFKPIQIEVMWNFTGHLGQCVIHFEGSFSGMKNALALENYFLNSGHGRRDYEKAAKDGNLGKDFYGWLATEEDAQGRFGAHGAEIAKYLSKWGTVKDVEVMEQDMKRIFDQQVRHLKVTVHEKEEKNARLATEMEVMRRASEAEREQQEIQHRRDLEALRVKAKKSEDRFAQVNLESNRALETKDAELRQLYKGLEEKKSSPKSEAEKSQIETQMIKNRELRETISKKQGALVQNQAKMVSLLQKHENELRQFAERAHQEEVKLLRRQKVEAQEHQLHYLIEMEEMQKQVSRFGISDGAGQSSMDVDANPAEASQRIKELEEELNDLKEDADIQSHTFNTLVGKEARATEELALARGCGVKALDFLAEKKSIADDAFQKAKQQKKYAKQPSYKDAPQVDVKVMGSIDEGPWLKAFKERGIDDAKGIVTLSKWETRITNQGYQPFRKEKFGPEDDDWKQVVDENDKHLSALRAQLGQEVYQTVAVALQELEEHNPSGRYTVSKAWIFDSEKGRAADLKDVVKYLHLITEGLMIRTNSMNKRARPQ